MNPYIAGTVPEEYRLLCLKILELCDRSEYELAASRFLSPGEAYFAAETLRMSGYRQNADFFLYGGYGSADRCMLIRVPEYIQSYALTENLSDGAAVSALTEACGDFISENIAVLRISGSTYRSLSHRDYLGSILALGIKRELVGDIIPESDHAAAVVICRSILPYLSEALLRVANDAVTVKEITLPADFSPMRNFDEIRDTVASPRLDAVISALVGISREKSAQMIRAGLAEHQYRTAADCDAGVSAGDIISVRGYGKFIVDEISSRTKKDRIRLLARKYK